MYPHLSFSLAKPPTHLVTVSRFQQFASEVLRAEAVIRRGWDLEVLRLDRGQLRGHSVQVNQASIRFHRLDWVRQSLRWLALPRLVRGQQTRLYS